MLPIPTLFSRLGTLGLILLLLLSGNEASTQELREPNQFVQAVLSRHPALVKADDLVRAAEFGVKASGLQPNPTLTLAATTGDFSNTPNSLTQSFEISGQTRLRSQMANAQLQAANLQRDAVRRKVAASAYRDWLTLWKSDRLLELALLREQLMQDTLRVARRRFEVGEIAENESLRVELAAAQATTNKIQTQASLLSAQRKAALLLGIDTQQLTSLVITWEPTALLPELTLDNVLDAAEQHPAVQAQFSLLEALRSGSELVGKERAPILSLSIYQSSFIRHELFERGAQVSVTWPVLDWGSIRNRKAQQLAEADAHRAGIDEVLLQTKQELLEAWTQLEASRLEREVLTLQGQRYEELAREARIAYDAGLLNLTDVLQTESSYREAGEQLVKIKSQIIDLEVQILEKTGLNLPQDFLKEDA